MEKMKPSFEKTFIFLIYGSLIVLVLGLLTSMTLLAFSHILLIIPVLYFLPKANYKAFPKSAWSLLALTIGIILSVIVNQDIALEGLKPIFKAKYFLFGFLSISPLAWFFMGRNNDKRISVLLYSFCIATTVATSAGLIGMKTGYLPLLMTPADQVRNGGVFGMMMNYAHNLSYFLIIVVGLLINRNRISKYINIKFLSAVLVINLVGFYMTFSRGAWLGFLAGIPFYFFKKNKRLFFYSLFGIFIAGAITYFVAGRAMYRPDYDATRVGQWQASIAAFKERPVLGYGYLNFEKHSVELKKRYNLLMPDFRGHAHSNFLEILSTTGAIGFIAFISWLFFWSLEMFKRDDFISGIGLAFIVTFIIGGATQSTISLGINLFFIMWAYVLSQLYNYE
jgi:O-antigen ligase